MENCVKGFINSCPHLTIKTPKKVAEIRLCGAVVLSIYDDADFIMPTEEQRKNLKEMLCIEVVPFEEA